MKITKSLFILTIFLLSACSNYKVGRLMHPQIRTIGIGHIKNDTDQPRLSLFMIEKLKERIMQDASLRVVPVEEADIILTGTIVGYKTDTRGYEHQDRREKDNDAFFATIFRASITFKYEVKTRKQWDLLSDTVTEGADFTEIVDQFEEQTNAFRRAAYEVSKKVVVQITEAW